MRSPDMGTYLVFTTVAPFKVSTAAKLTPRRRISVAQGRRLVEAALKDTYHGDSHPSIGSTELFPAQAEVLEESECQGNGCSDGQQDLK